MNIGNSLTSLKQTLPEKAILVAVSKTKPIEAILEAYSAGHRVFGENKIQEMVSKWETLPKDIEWHMIGHVQTNKVKYMAPFVSLIHAIDSEKLLEEIQKQGAKNNRIISGLIQVRIAKEETKFGAKPEAVKPLLEYAEKCPNILIDGLMGMASFTSDENQIRKEFSSLAEIYSSLQQQFPKLKYLSMGMSGDYTIALEIGSNMIRVGSKIFGERNY